jgi:hypothetical protein
MKAKHFFIFTAVLSVVVMLVGSGYAEIEHETIIGVWMFNEGEGDLAGDSSENGLDGKIMNGANWVDGKFGDALELDGINDYVDLGTDERLKPQHLTILAWFNTRKLNGYGHIFQTGNDWDDMAGIVFRVHQDGYFQAAAAQGPGNVASWVNGPGLSDNTWYHAALTFDGTIIILYIDGVEVARTAGAEILYDQWPARIGSHSHDVGSLFNGFIDEVAYFSEALEEKDVVAIMNEGLEKTVGVDAVSSSGKLATTWGCVKGY